MPKSKFVQSDSEENVPSEEGVQKDPPKLPNYEMQRLNRIEENKKRMEALGLHKMANSFMGSVQENQKKSKEKKGKKKIDDEDDDYNPAEDGENISSSSEEDESDEEFSLSQKKRNSSPPNKRGPIKKPVLQSDCLDDDDALMQAIALSLQDNINTAGDKRKEKSHFQNDSGKSKRRKTINSRVQMTEDEILVHFFQFDETGRGGLNLRDVQRLATAHDFTWSEKEMADMIYCFDNDGDGKINFDDFRKIVVRCNMLKGW